MPLVLFAFRKSDRHVFKDADGVFLFVDFVGHFRETRTESYSGTVRALPPIAPSKGGWVQPSPGSTTSRWPETAKIFPDRLPLSFTRILSRPRIRGHDLCFDVFIILKQLGDVFGHRPFAVVNRFDLNEFFLKWKDVFSSVPPLFFRFSRKGLGVFVGEEPQGRP